MYLLTCRQINYQILQKKIASLTLEYRFSRNEGKCISFGNFYSTKIVAKYSETKHNKITDGNKKNVIKNLNKTELLHTNLLAALP